jgi:hypothetical protein
MYPDSNENSTFTFTFTFPLTHPVASSHPGPLEFFSRLTGLLVFFPSLMFNVQTLNCIIITYNGTFVQKQIIFSVLVAMLTDVLMAASVLGWVLDPDWDVFAILTLAFVALKRFYSINVADLTYRRYEAITVPKIIMEEEFYIGRATFTFVYSLLSLATFSTIFAAYYLNGFSSPLARQSQIFTVHRVLNFIETGMIVLFGKSYQKVINSLCSFL